jgi:hypothetical protein
MNKKQLCSSSHELKNECPRCNQFIYIPNFFDLENMNELSPKKMSLQKVKDFIDEYEDAIMDDVSFLIQGYLNDFFESKNKTTLRPKRKSS